MKRWTSTWAAMVFAGFLAVPAVGVAQTPAAPAAAAMTTPQDQSSASSTQQGGPQQHLQEADAALSSISSSAVSGKAKSQIADLKKHVSNLEKMANGATADKGTSKGEPKWASEAAAADKVLSELLASDASTGAPAAATPT